MKAMILAAGRGERMRPLTDTTPKPLLPVGGKPLMQYHIEALKAAGVTDIVINLAWLGDLIRDALGDGARFGVTITYSDEGDSALETGGGIFEALPLLGPDPFLVVSGDIWTDCSLARVGNSLAANDIAHFVMVPNPDFHARGDFALTDGRLATSGELLTYANIGVFRSEFFAGCTRGRFPLAPLMREWIGRGRVGGELHEGRWCNVGTPAQLQELDASLRLERR
jgi:N-acetyl-alpha-D-muramate 1-phosphate uridylyltransferase